MRMIDADLIQYEPMLSAKGNGMYEDVMVAYKSQIDEQPTIELDWTELMVICDNCGHAIHVKRTDVKPIIESERRKGKWIYLIGLDAFECSCCGRQMVRNIFDYCPWCGSDMRGET